MEGIEPSAAAELSELVRAREPEILEHWADAIRADALFPDLSDSALRYHLPRLLEQVTHALEAKSGAPPTVRLDGGLTGSTVLSALALLRKVIVRVWMRGTEAIRVSELVRFNQVLDGLMLASVKSFAEARARMLSVIEQISSTALGTEALDSLLPRLLAVVQRAGTPVDMVMILLFEGDRLQVHTSSGLEGDPNDFAAHDKTSFAGRIASERAPRALCAGNEANGYAEAGAMRRERIRVLYGAPLLHEGAVLGVAFAGSRQSEAFTQADEQLFLAMAGRATNRIVLSRYVNEELKAKRSLDALLAASPVAIGFIDRDLRYLEVNDALAAVNGRPVSEHIGRTIDEILPAPVVTRLKSVVDEILRTGVSQVDREINAPLANRSEATDTWVANFFPVQGARGEVLGFGGIGVNITERKKALDVAQQRAAELEAVLQSIPEGVFVGNEDGVTRANQPALKQIGVHSLEDLNGGMEDLVEHLKPRDPETGAPLGLEEQPFVLAFEGMPSPREQIIHPLDGGPERILRCSAAPVRVDGEVVATVTINTDVTVKRRKEAELRDQEERLRLALEAEQAGLFDEDLVKEEKRWDDRCKALFGIAPDEEVTPERAADAIHPEDRERVLEAFLAASDPRRPGRYSIEYRTRPGLPGGERWLSAQGTMFFSATGKPQRLIGTMKDITKRKRSELKLAQTALFRDQFIGILGHDLRNPLSAIRASAQLLLRKPLEPGQEKALWRIVHSSGRMGRMISDVLDLARGHLGGGLPLHRQRMNLPEVCRHVLDELGVTHPDRSLLLDVQTDGWGEWDPDRVAQVVSNLVGNALEHGMPDEPVRVKISEAAGSSSEVCLAVHNEGDPIPPAQLWTIFEPFRSSPQPQRGSKGLGLGLYIVHQIAEAHGGTVKVHSTAEDGTTFEVRLPRKPPSH